MRRHSFGNSVPNDGCLPGCVGHSGGPTARLLAGSLIGCAVVCWLSTAAGPSLAAETPARNSRMPPRLRNGGRRSRKIYQGVHLVALSGPGLGLCANTKRNLPRSPREKKWQHLPAPQWLPQVVLFATQPELRRVYAYSPFPGSAATMGTFRQRAKRWGCTVSIPATTNGRSCLRNTTLLTCTSRTTRQCF